MSKGTRGRTSKTLGKNDRLLKAESREAHGTASLSDRPSAPLPQVVREYIAACVCPFCGKGPYKLLSMHTYRIHAVDSAELKQMAELPARTATSSDEFRQAQRDKFVSFDAETRARMLAAAHEARRGRPPTAEQVERRLRSQRWNGQDRGPFDSENTGDSRHGGRWAYQQGCRCDRCKAANAADQRAYQERKKARAGSATARNETGAAPE